MKLTPFHIAVPVRDLDEAREFYINVLGCSEGRSSESWADFNLYGHQFVCHVNPDIGKDGRLQLHRNEVDAHSVPVPHYGVVLEMDAWQALADRLQSLNIAFLVEPYIRFKGLPGEQATMFFMDPTGNALEFKAFKDIERQLFET